MPILFFDTETTGKKKKGGIENPEQPNLVQLAAILTNDDLLPVSSVNLIVYPYDWTIPAEASDIHGVPQDIAEQYGVGLSKAVSVFAELTEIADKYIAHNIEYDEFVMRRAAWQVGLNAPLFGEGKPKLCTMKAATSVVQVLHKDPKHDKDWKWPKLEECVRHFFNREIDGAHDALVDVSETINVYRELCKHYGMKP